MDETFNEFYKFGDLLVIHGRDIVTALAILVIGLIATQWLIRHLRQVLQKRIAKPPLLNPLIMSLNILMIALVAALALSFIGVPAIVIRRILLAALLGGIGLIVLFRPYLPTLPYKVGNTVEMGGLLGKVEATTFLHTRLRTFDGRTLFIPNRMVFNDIVSNYHYTPTRQIRLYLTIGYREDMLKAKTLLKRVLTEDPRIQEKPAPTVYVLSLTENGVVLSARGWVENQKFFKARCELYERVKLLFDDEGIAFAHPQRDVHLDGQSGGWTEQDTPYRENPVEERI
ncbi:Small-conductance mechanosensitive channel [uncultured Desulfatiglans sp.]|nr:Small-conductance mechanosensitive channel [uncultured Desulfatiglans sp.]